MQLRLSIEVNRSFSTGVATVLATGEVDRCSEYIWRHGRSNVDRIGCTRNGSHDPSHG